MFPRRLALPLLASLALGACSYPGTVSGSAPNYPAGYQPVMGGQAVFWPEQPGAIWGPEDVPGIDVFFEPLSPHGRWVESRWGQAFIPNAPAGWRPYQNGQWLENRFWLSADPWGWATDHYGRWGFDDAMGWVWVPDVRWGPSWVAWREAEEVVGWAPIPPRVQWDVGLGFGSGWGYDNWNSWYGPSWVWVPRTTLFISGFGGRLLPWNYGNNWWGRSRWQHSPYWGWNQGWDRGWGWQAPPFAWNNWAGRNPGWSNWGWNRPGWNHRGRNNNGWNNGWNGGWNGGSNNGGWNRPGWDRDRNRPRNGAPGSVGDRIGRDLTGQPPAGWQGNRPRGERGQTNGGFGNGANGEGRRDGRFNGDGANGWNGNRRVMGMPPSGGRPPVAANNGGVSGSVAGGLAGNPGAAPPPPSRGGWQGQGQGQGQNQPRNAPQSQPQPQYRAQPSAPPPQVANRADRPAAPRYERGTNGGQGGADRGGFRGGGDRGDRNNRRERY
jgi:hypothetical protein